MPTQNDEMPVIEVAVDWLRERSAVGVERYKTLLKPGNGRDFGRDADEEMADWFLYWVGYRIEHARHIRELLALVGKQAEEIKALKCEVAAMQDDKALLDWLESEMEKWRYHADFAIQSDEEDGVWFAKITRLHCGYLKGLPYEGNDSKSETVREAIAAALASATKGASEQPEGRP